MIARSAQTCAPATRRQRTPAGELPEVEEIVARCPACGSRRLLAYKTIDQGDDTLLKYAQCECGQRVKIISE